MNRFLIVVLFGLFACGPDVTYGPVLEEQGRVTQMLYVPSGHGSGSGVGFAGGRAAVVATSTYIPERYGIVFACLHGSFAVEGEEAEQCWESIRQGEDCVIQYREVFEERDGQQVAVDLDFVNALPVR